MKDTLIEIKNNLKENDSKVDEAEDQIHDMEHKKAKTTSQNNKEKKEFKRKSTVYTASGQLQAVTHLHHGGV